MKYKRIAALLLLAAFLLCGCRQAEEPENPYRIKTQTVERYQSEAVQTVRSEYTYDENSRVIEIQTYYDEDWHSTMRYIRDDYGNVIRNESAYADGTQTWQEAVLTLDDQNRVIRKESTWDNGQHVITEYAYNKDGLTTKHYIYRLGLLDGQDLNSLTDSTYDRKGNLIRQDVRWEPHNNNDGYSIYTYKQDRLVRGESYIGEELDSCTEYTYDETGLIQTAVVCKADGTPETKHVTTFDEYGNKLEVVAYAYYQDLMLYGETNEEPDSRTVYTYELKE